MSILIYIQGIKLTGGFENGGFLKDILNIIWPLANL